MVEEASSQTSAHASTNKRAQGMRVRIHVYRSVSGRVGDVLAMLHAGHPCRSTRTPAAKYTHGGMDPFIHVPRYHVLGSTE
jgi:hypothetical protein